MSTMVVQVAKNVPIRRNTRAIETSYVAFAVPYVAVSIKSVWGSDI